MLNQKAVANLTEPLREAIEAATRGEDMRYRHEPFGWARVMLEEGEEPRP
ncbi:MAG: hypothetical protein PHD04_03325 [Candidatus Pacebacteria bacterium]|nr:hypothetical protein [Candidatus Paceibacterota bacterium]